MFQRGGEALWKLEVQSNRFRLAHCPSERNPTLPRHSRSRIFQIRSKQAMK
jgi:hypothetical protein